jgi:PKD repeat protein/subtilisin-like proprotein convertase family protein
LSPSGPQTYGVVTGGAPAVTRSFTFTAAGTCGGSITTVLQLQDGVINYGNFTNTFILGVAGASNTNNYSSGGVAASIQDFTTVDVPIVVAGVGSITDVNVKVRLTHTWDGDMAISLIHPDGTAVALASNQGGPGDDFGSGASNCSGTFTVFDDSAGTAIGAGTAPFAGSYRPDGSLAALNGKSMTGTWYLRINDVGPQDTGIVHCVQLDIATPTYTCTDCSSTSLAITGNPSPQDVCTGSLASFTVTAAGANLAYQWQKNSVDLSEGGHYSGVSNATLNVSPTDAGDAANYRCLVSNTGGSVTSTVAALTIKTPTAVTSQPVFQGVCLAGSAQFSVTATGAGVITYQWQKNTVDLSNSGHYSGVTSNVLTVVNADNSDAATYRCVVTADCGSVNSSNATLTVSYPVLSVNPGSLSFGTIVTGATAYSSFTVSNIGCGTLNVTATTGGPFGVNTNLLGVTAGGATNVTVSFAPGSAAAFTNNVLFSSNGGTSTNLVTGNGAEAPIAGFTAMPTSGQVPLNVTFTDTSTGTITNRFWQFGDGGMTNTLATNVVHVYAAPGSNTVWLLVSGPVGVSSNSALVVVLTAFEQWQMDQFGCLTCPQAAATADPDGDGFTNEQEFLAGTNPQNSLSALRIVTTAASNGNFYVTFTSASGRFYDVQRNANLVVTNGWSTFTNNVPGTGGTVLVVDPGAGAWTNMFYRVRLAP